jgi:ABC-type transport system involved in cytochrome c biogenesis permease subunit
VLLAGCIGVVSLSLELGLDIPFAGAATSLAAAGAVLATMWFPSEAHLLPPALRSPYFAPHVLCYFIAYGALTASGLGGLVYLVALTAGTRLNRRGAAFLGGVQSWMARSSQIGFPFLTLGIVLGALWAQVAFTDYWSWDPKEVWALVTWLLVAAHLHMTNVDDRRGAPAAALAVVAMAALYFTLFGVNYLPTAPQSLHTYIEP